jgi:hypothetical protein
VLKVFCVPKRVLLAHGIRVGGKPQQSLTYLSRLEGRLIVTATCSLRHLRMVRALPDSNAARVHCLRTFMAQGSRSTWSPHAVDA